MELVPVAAMVSFVIACVNFAKAIKVKNMNGIVTQAVVWASGVSITMLAAQTDFAGGIKVTEELNLAALNGWSQVFAGLAFGSGAMLVNEFKQAFDQNDSAVKPPFIQE